MDLATLLPCCKRLQTLDPSSILSRWKRKGKGGPRADSQVWGRRGESQGSDHQRRRRDRAAYEWTPAQRGPRKMPGARAKLATETEPTSEGT
jgi:hypothetical protein